MQIQGERTVRDYYPRGSIAVAARAAEKKKLLAAAYCRVSSDKDEQADSYERQVAYYTEFIKSRADEYELVGIFADKGTSGLSMRRRKKFNEMVAMALDGKINIIDLF
jgi:predicted site-specific integrase-resolvase